MLWHSYNLSIQGRMQIFTFVAVNLVFEKEIEGFRSWECRIRHRINLLYILHLSNPKKVHSALVLGSLIAKIEFWLQKTQIYKGIHVFILCMQSMYSFYVCSLCIHSMYSFYVFILRIRKQLKYWSRKSSFCSKASRNYAKRCAVVHWSIFLLNDVTRRLFWGVNNRNTNQDNTDQKQS